MRLHIHKATAAVAAVGVLFALLTINGLAQARQQRQSVADERAVVRAIQTYERTCRDTHSTLQDRSVALGLLLQTLGHVEGR